MKAAVYHGPHDMRVEQVPDKKPAEDEVLIQVKYCGICGTDIHIYHGDGGSFEVNPPLIPGHEFSGVVVEVGSKVSKLSVGDRVSVDPNVMCGECYYCKNSMEHFCTNNIGIGTTVDGGFAEYAVAKASHVYKVPDTLDFVSAAMTEPVSCCVHGIDLCRIKPGNTVLVIGGGPIGIIMMQLAKYSGASKVIMSEPVAEKRELALKLGATAAVNPIEEDVDAFLAEYTENVDCVIECAGRTATQADAIRFAGKGATVMFFGLAGPDDAISLKPDDVFKKELHITSSFINPYTFSRAIQILDSGVLDVKSIIAQEIPLEVLPEALEDPSYRRTGKVMVKISE
ncbi:MAG: zinc-dependent alcohol dehydrogenase family protein [Lachnospiraceae bacterium]|nr:zinc-dependent alcohol dehydrogenase family protein [Lachnospiraceae bacterium]